MTNDDNLNRIVAKCRAELEQITERRLEAIAHYEALTDAIFCDPELARKNIDELSQQLRENEVFTVIERGGTFDFNTKTWISLRHRIGETKSANERECEIVERSLYEVREAKMDINHQTRQYDKVERQLKLVLEEKARRDGQAERSQFAGGSELERSDDGSRTLDRRRTDGKSGTSR